LSPSLRKREPILPPTAAPIPTTQQAFERQHTISGEVEQKSLLPQATGRTPERRRQGKGNPKKPHKKKRNEEPPLSVKWKKRGGSQATKGSAWTLGVTEVVVV